LFLLSKGWGVILKVADTFINPSKKFREFEITCVCETEEGGKTPIPEIQ
jgi:hypothetical protein